MGRKLGTVRSTTNRRSDQGRPHENEADRQNDFRGDVIARVRQGSRRACCPSTRCSIHDYCLLSAAIWSAHRSRVRPVKTSTQDHVNHAARTHAKSSCGNNTAAISTSAHVR